MIFLAEQQDDGCWLVKCPLCEWKESLPTEREAQVKLNNHINTKHQTGRESKVTPIPPVKPAAEMPPQLPGVVKER
jgi:hypothetical protein